MNLAEGTGAKLVRNKALKKLLNKEIHKNMSNLSKEERERID